jgi:cytochrome c oxidase subunit 2
MAQATVWIVTVVLVVAMAAVFVFVAMRSGDRVEYSAVQPRAYRIRTVFFWLLIVVGVPLTIYTLRDLPYGAAARLSGDVQVVDVIGFQWYWEVSADEVTAGRPVEFRVTSGDVNHGLGIYDASLQLVAQVQAMPGYTNRLVHTFSEPGVYTIACLEYCGLVHYDMTQELRVTGEPPPQ